nr:unnamed protein product [Callosobruchus chinensis]CAH7755864.1 unnamed protein product [Callosobruchus chinensis]
MAHLWLKLMIITQLLL